MQCGSTQASSAGTHRPNKEELRRSSRVRPPGRDAVSRACMEPGEFQVEFGGITSPSPVTKNTSNRPAPTTNSVRATRERYVTKSGKTMAIRASAWALRASEAVRRAPAYQWRACVDGFVGFGLPLFDPDTYLSDGYPFTSTIRISFPRLIAAAERGLSIDPGQKDCRKFLQRMQPGRNLR